jgi:hypothetical protein
MSDRQIKMKIYLDSLDSYYSISHEPKEKQKPTLPKKEIIATKLVITMAIIAIVKISILVLWI